MNEKHLNALVDIAERHGCKYLTQEPLSRHTTFKVGGNCTVMIFINSVEALSQCLGYCSKENVKKLVLGNGSNVLCSDKGFDGAVLLLGKDFQNISLADDETIEVQAGCTLGQLCMFALNSGLSGLEFAYGIPGTVGGAVFMNAGAYDGEMSFVLTKAEAVNESGDKRIFGIEEMALGYRTSVFQNNGYIVTKAWLKLCKGSSDKIKEKMDEFMSRRRSKQPLEYPSAGSAFKRPVGSFAGKLIQESGLRGYTVGGAQVSEKHCGFVINKNNATFSDIKTLLQDVQRIVREKTGYTLECEVRIIE